MIRDIKKLLKVRQINNKPSTWTVSGSTAMPVSPSDLLLQDFETDKAKISAFFFFISLLSTERVSNMSLFQS